jgi:4a-hydroxytetrahydrobiopterin dehydratase
MFQQIDNFLIAQFMFKDFKQAFAFMTEVAFEAEAHGHHPNWENVYNKVLIKLTTHDAGNIVTEKDHSLAVLIQDIYAKYEKR